MVGDAEMAECLTGKRAITAVASPADFVALIAPVGVPVLTLYDFLRIVELNYLQLPQRFDAQATKVASEINVGLARRG